jgi:hypothetical protein
MRTYQCWISAEDDEITFSTEENIEILRKQNLLGKDPVLVYEFQSDSWVDAMTEHHQRQGWEPYVPMT